MFPQVETLDFDVVKRKTDLPVEFHDFHKGKKFLTFTKYLLIGVNIKVFPGEKL